MLFSQLLIGHACMKATYSCTHHSPESETVGRALWKQSAFFANVCLMAIPLNWNTVNKSKRHCYL